LARYDVSIQALLAILFIINVLSCKLTATQSSQSIAH